MRLTLLLLLLLFLDSKVFVSMRENSAAFFSLAARSAAAVVVKLNVLEIWSFCMPPILILDWIFLRILPRAFLDSLDLPCAVPFSCTFTFTSCG